MYSPTRTEKGYTLTTVAFLESTKKTGYPLGTSVLHTAVVERTSREPEIILAEKKLYMFAPVSDYFLPDLRSRSFSRLWTSFFYRICEADPLTAFGLVSSTGSAKRSFNRLWTRDTDKPIFVKT